MSEPIQLSYSSWSQLESCETAYAHRKIYQTPVDNDEEDRTAFDCGSATHECMEVTGWGTTALSQAIVNDAVTKFEYALPHKVLVHAMALKLIEQQKMSGLSCVKAELQITSPEFVGFIDLIAKNSLGQWYIVDLKTASAKPTDGTMVRLPMDRQLNLYASFAERLAPMLDLNPALFKGCIYRVVTKSKANQKPTENYNQFLSRVFELTSVYDIFVPREVLNTQVIVAEHLEAHKRVTELHQGVAPKRNLGACFNFFKLCPYFSQCHGAKPEDILTRVKLMTNKDYKLEADEIGDF